MIAQYGRLEIAGLLNLLVDRSRLAAANCTGGLPGTAGQGQRE